MGACLAGRHTVHHKKTDLSPMSPFLQAANDVSLKKKTQIFFVLNFLLVTIAAAGLLYVLVKHSGETIRIVHIVLCVILFLLLGIQAAALMYFKRNIIKPLAEMQAASRLMADGHLETLNHTKREDEIGSLGENINDLAMNMQEVLLFVWNHSQLSRDLLENIADDLNFSLDADSIDSIDKDIQKDISTMHRNNENLKSIVMSFSYFEIKLEDEKMVSDYQQEPGVTFS
ncbi:HAMP domain-containing protein [Candidatus Electrothrix sp.]|uniref:HAMP domain-containing protein n=1 Tax=Candidatus Electrothrix sp. TaxID=2170559 RepID=UPI004057C364